MNIFGFLPVESTLRELDYKLNLARYFSHAGFKIVLGNPPFIRDELKYGNYKGFFLEKGANPTENYYKDLRTKGIHLYDLSDEGNAKPVYSITYEPAVNALLQMNRIFLWGEAQRSDLIARNHNESLQEKYYVIGSPMFDLCCAKYRQYHVKSRPKSLPENYILVNTNFGDCNGYNIEEQLKACIGMSVESYESMVKRHESEAEQFATFKEWLDEIISSFPNEIFVIRPHPVEIQENYEKLFGKYSNVIVSKEGNANQIIASAKVVMHKDCTTAFQSYLMRVPVVALGGYNFAKEHTNWTVSFGEAPKSIAEAKSQIEYLIKHNNWDINTQAKIDARVKSIIAESFYDLGNSTRELSALIISDTKYLFTQDEHYTFLDSRTLLQKIKKKIRRYLPLYYKVPKASQIIMKKITKREIISKLILLEDTDPLGLKYTVKELFPNAFMISAKSR